MRDHIFPNTLSPSLVLYSVSLGAAMLVAAGLSFLGAGIPPPTAEWGAMITEGLPYIQDWWMTVFPGIMITGAVLGFNMFGEALREAMDVTLRR
jgi:peptide/nickel transport system permease protein